MSDTEVGYAEAARSYRGVWYSVLGVAAGFGIDLLFGVHGAIVHLPGWIILGGIIVATHVLMIYAARSTHSLSLTADEVRVGDEALQRARITGLTPPDSVAELEVPVLGWPNGRPRGIGIVVVRLDDDRDVAVPTRFPARLQSELGVGVSASRPEAVPRPAGADDLPLLADVDDRAEAIFRVAGYHLPQVPFDDRGLGAARAVFVADSPPVGFVWVDEVDGCAHIEELAVIPSAMRRGIGTALLDAACSWAAGESYRAITLITFADVPWNAPFYAGRGFEPIDEPGQGLQRLRERERDLGLDAVGQRVVMRRTL